MIHRYGALASIELNLRTHYKPADMSREQMKEVIGDFVSAAYRCKAAGMDMVMVHGGHGHLIGNFFSPHYNRRTDEYGAQSLENRCRFAGELLDAIRQKIGDEMAIEYRISADELHDQGVRAAESLEFAKIVQDKIDLIHVSAGDLYQPATIPYMIQPHYLPRGVNVHFAEMFKKELKIPVVTVGSMNMEMAEQIIAEGKADMVAMIRAFIAEPDLVNKAQRNEGDTIRPCIRCTVCNSKMPHIYCLPVRCAVNPLNGREAEFMNQPPVNIRKKVVVIGGGPAGMQAARDAADRGHKVVLFEKNGALGGALIQAAASPLKEDMKKYLEWAVRMTINHPNIGVKLSTEATQEDVLAENPDALVIAVGAEPSIPDIPGVHRKNVAWAVDVSSGKVWTGDTVVLAGAGLTGSETALLLAKEGKKVTLIDMLPLEIIDQNSPNIATNTLRRMLRENGVATITEVKLLEITEQGAVIEGKDQKVTLLPCDTVVLSLGVKPRRELVEKFQNLIQEVYVVGDCRHAKGNLFKATSDGFYAAMSM
jgi:NADPH-dependent 2,4-dienoyl-CoA reductase/sulfur reductase-like enzyme